jgi:hypothetical protein
MRRLCHARTRSGGRCRRSALPNRLRCKLHGGLGGRPRGYPMRPNTRIALVAGRRRWLERMRALKAAGLIIKFPGGRPRGLAPRSKDRTIARAQRVLEEIMMANKKPTVPALPSKVAAPAVKPWDEMTKAEKLSFAVDLGLDVARRILELDVDPDNVRLLAQQKDVALTLISQQIRVDEGGLRPPSGEQPMLEFEAALARQEARLRLSEPTHGKPRKSKEP